MQGLCLVPSPSLGKAAEVLGASSTLSLVCFPWQQIALCYPHVSHTQLLVGAGVGGGSAVCCSGEGHGGKVPAHGWEKILFP